MYGTPQHLRPYLLHSAQGFTFFSFSESIFDLKTTPRCNIFELFRKCFWVVPLPQCIFQIPLFHIVICDPSDDHPSGQLHCHLTDLTPDGAIVSEFTHI